MAELKMKIEVDSTDLDAAIEKVEKLRAMLSGPAVSDALKEGVAGRSAVFGCGCGIPGKIVGDVLQISAGKVFLKPATIFSGEISANVNRELIDSHSVESIEKIVDKEIGKALQHGGRIHEMFHRR